MKKILSSLFIASSAIALTGCVAEEADIFDKSAAERLNEISDLYTRRLVKNGGTWVLEYYPTSNTEVKLGNGHLIPCRFYTDRSVLMAMNDSVSDNLYKESVSGWEVITDNGPVLTFNTFNDVLHTFSNPETDIKETTDNETGKGYEGDYEFVIKDLQEDATVAMLKGKKRGTYCRMTRIPTETNFKEYLDDIKAFAFNVFPEEGHELLINIDKKKYRVQKMYNHLPNIYPVDGDAIIDGQISPYLITLQDGKYHLRFRDAIEGIDGEEQEFVYDEANDCFRGQSNSENVLCGPEPNNYFWEVLSEFTNVKTARHAWRLNRTSEKSPEFTPTFNSVERGITKLGSNAKFVDMYFYREYNSNNLLLSLDYSYKLGGTTVTPSALFTFEFKETENGAELTYKEPFNEESNQFIKLVPSMSTLLSELSTSLKMEANPNRFNLSKIRCTSVANENIWFVLNAYYNHFTDK